MARRSRAASARRWGGGLLLVVAVAGGLVACAGGAIKGSVPRPRPVPVPHFRLHITALPSPVSAHRVDRGTGAATLGGGAVWIAFGSLPSSAAGVGEVVGMSASTGRVVARWPGSGSPASLTWSRQTLWEIGNAGDLSSPYAYANDLIAISPRTGQLLQRIPVPSPEPPYGVAAFHGTVYVLGNTNSGNASELWQLTGGRLVPKLHLPGGQPPGDFAAVSDLTVCGPSLYAVTSKRPASTAILVTRLALPSLKTVERWTLPAGGGFGCAPGGVVVVQQYSSAHALTILRNGMTRVGPSFGPVTLHASLVVIGNTLWVPRLLPPPSLHRVSVLNVYAWPTARALDTYHLPHGTLQWAMQIGPHTFWYNSYGPGKGPGPFPITWWQVNVQHP